MIQHSYTINYPLAHTAVYTVVVSVKAIALALRIRRYILIGRRAIPKG